MIRRSLFLIAALFAAAPALADGVPPEQLAKPPADAKVWTLTSSNGVSRHGQTSLWTDKDGTHWSRFSFNLRGFVTEMDEQNRFAKDGSLQSPDRFIVRGHNPQGDVAETYEGRRTAPTPITTPVDHGTRQDSGSPISTTSRSAARSIPSSSSDRCDAEIAGHSFNGRPHCRRAPATIAPLTHAPGCLERALGEKKHLTAYAITGFGLSPFPVWMDGDKFFGTPGVAAISLPEGWEKRQRRCTEQGAGTEALAKLAPAQYAADPRRRRPAPSSFTQRGKLYDSDARKFRDAMTVVVDKGLVTAVGPSASTKAPAGAQVIDGTGKTLIPGLWDNHQHYGDDSTGPLLLASGITSVRDPGNQEEELLARKKRIDDGQLLGQRIVPSLLIDGPGPFTAQVAYVVHNEAEAVAAVHRAKSKGYFGIKIYGSMDPAWVKPMATLAHQLGLRVHGHIPHGMRPLDAVHAGYDEITHINWVMMQAMPDDVVKDSNGMGRFVGTGKYAKDVDLHSKMMTAYLDELAARHIAVDPTLVTFEDLYVPDPGTFPPADAPYADTLPSQFARGFLSSAMAPTLDLSRETMRASFNKLKDLVVELNKRHIFVLAGTDGVGFELIRELQLYTEAGLSVEDALATATINPATVYGMSDKTGSLAKGKLAELALIDGDPSKDITQLRQVELVMRDVKMMDALALRASLGISGPPKK